MKMIQTKVFQPITLTFDTQAEFNHFMAVVVYTSENSEGNPNIETYALELKNIGYVFCNDSTKECIRDNC